MTAPHPSLEHALRQLPDCPPPPGGWQRLSQQLDARRLARHRRQQWGGLALAASLLLALALPGWRAQTPAAIAPADDRLQPLRQASAALETELAGLRDRAEVWDAHSADTAACLQYDLALLDWQITEYAALDADPASQAVARRPDDLTALWQHRVQRLQALVQQHRAAPSFRDTPTGTQASPCPAENLETLEI